VIGDGLTVALDAIEDVGDEAPDTPAAALLLSDGRDTGSNISPDDAAARAASIEVPVFTVVIGEVAEDGGPGANLEALEAIADTSGGNTFTAETSDELTTIYSDLGSALSVELAVEPSTTPWVIAAIALTILPGLMLVFTPR
jgi:Ca-activated chloride channel homolog